MIQIWNKYDTNKVQVWYKYDIIGYIQINYKYGTICFKFDTNDSNMIQI